jgi:hypothetical protein
MMKTIAPMICAAGLGLVLSGCAYRAEPAGPYGYAAGGPYYEGYYDDFYGPVDEGFWGPDGYFYYGDSNHHFHRGEPGHFRRDAAPGFHRFRTHSAPAPHVEGGHGGGEHR